MKSYIQKDQVQVQSNDFKSFLYLFRFAKKFKYQLSASLLILIIASSAGAISAYCLGKMIDQGLLLKNWKVFMNWALIMIALDSTRIFLDYVGRRILSYYSLESVFEIRKALFQHMQELPMIYYDQQPAGRIITRTTNDVESIENFFSGTLSRLSMSIFSIVTVLVTAFAINAHLSFLMLVSVIPALFFTYLFRNPVRIWYREFSKRNSAINSKLSEFLKGIFIIRSFSLEKWSSKIFQNKVQSHLDAALKINKINSTARPLVLFCSILPLPVLVFFGGQAVVAGTMTLGVLITFIRLSEKFSRPLFSISHELHVVQQAFIGAERIASFLKEKKEPTETTSLNFKKQKIKGNIEFKNLWLKYIEEGNEWILKDLSFSVAAGEKIGLVGRTGCGKTTTISLISRLYEYQKGSLLIDGLELKNYPREFLRKEIFTVSQDVMLFKGSIKENLSLGKKFSDADWSALLEKTGLGAHMEEKKWTLSSLLVESGKNLSEGEKQLISLSRAYLQKPSLLILDEATAKVDAAIEQRCQQALEEVMKDKSALFIAHRLQTLKNCDRLLLFKDGKILASGPHEELLQKSAYYKELHEKSDSD